MSMEVHVYVLLMDINFLMLDTILWIIKTMPVFI